MGFEDAGNNISDFFSSFWGGSCSSETQCADYIATCGSQANAGPAGGSGQSSPPSSSPSSSPVSAASAAEYAAALWTAVVPVSDDSTVSLSSVLETIRKRRYIFLLVFMYLGATLINQT